LTNPLKTKAEKSPEKMFIPMPHTGNKRRSSNYFLKKKVMPVIYCKGSMKDVLHETQILQAPILPPR
jgi:hypothetical protein